MLWAAMWAFMFLVDPYENLITDLEKTYTIGESFCLSLSSSTIFKNLDPISVFTFAPHGGLKKISSLCLAFRFFFDVYGLYDRL